MLDLKAITISAKRTSFVKAYAEIYFGEHYKRMFDDPINRIRSIYYGKLGEEAVAQYLNLTVNYGENVDKGYDLNFEEKTVAIKTKTAMTLPHTFNGWFCHIPIDQYFKIKENSNFLIACLALEHRAGSNCRVFIIGYLPMKDVDNLKILHQAGEHLTEFFTLPPPDSFGVAFSNFLSIKNFNSIRIL